MIYYFGTFNPVHNGHIQIAKDVANTLKTEVIFVPAYDSPWKPDLKNTFEHRINMLRLCKLNISDIEKDLPTPSYTYQTINALYKDETLHVIIGYDQFFHIEEWKHFEILKEKCHFIVIPRTVPEQDKYKRLSKMKDKGWKFNNCVMDLINISSSRIREYIKYGKDISKFIPKQVEDYIKENKLYFNSTP